MVPNNFYDPKNTLTRKFLTQKITSTQIYFGSPPKKRKYFFYPIFFYLKGIFLTQELFGTQFFFTPLHLFLLAIFFPFTLKLFLNPTKFFNLKNYFDLTKFLGAKNFSDPKVFLTQNIFLTNKITKKMYNKIFDKNYFFTKIFFYQMKFFNPKNFSVFWPKLIWPKRVLNKYKVLIDAYAKNSKVYKFEKFKKVF